MYGKVDTLEEFRKNIKKANVDDIIYPIVKTSEDAEKNWNQSIGFLWIDGNHEYNFVKLDFEKWFPYLIDGGIIAFHDTIYFSGVRKVVMEKIYKSKNFINIGVIDSITFAMKTNKISLKDIIINRYKLFLSYINYFIFKIKNYLPGSVKEIIKNFKK